MCWALDARCRRPRRAGVEGWEVGDRAVVHNSLLEGRRLPPEYCLTQAHAHVGLPDAWFTDAAAIPAPLQRPISALRRHGSRRGQPSLSRAPMAASAGFGTQLAHQAREGDRAGAAGAFRRRSRLRRRCRLRLPGRGPVGGRCGQKRRAAKASMSSGSRQPRGRPASRSLLFTQRTSRIDRPAAGHDRRAVLYLCRIDLTRSLWAAPIMPDTCRPSAISPASAMT